MRLLLERKHCKQCERTFSELAPNKARPLWDDAGISYLRSGKGSVGRGPSVQELCACGIGADPLAMGAFGAASAVPRDKGRRVRHLQKNVGPNIPISLKFSVTLEKHENV